MKEIIKTKICPRCLKNKSWEEYYIHKRGREKGKPSGYCQVCTKENNYLWKKLHPRFSTKRNHLTGKCQPMEESKNCSQYLGIVVAEKALSKFFDNITRMPNNNPGFDYICGKGFKIDVKSSCFHYLKNQSLFYWYFDIQRNQIADYFLCLAFDNRENLEPKHVWLIPNYIINNKMRIFISNKEKSLEKWLKYEKSLDKVIECCNKMKGEEYDFRPKKNLL